MIPPHSITRVKEATDLQVLAADYVTLKRSGAQYLCLCPFHKDSTPSLRIYHDHAYCFVCGAQKNAIGWVMHFEGIRFLDAMRSLAARAGVSLDDKPVSRVAMAYAREEATLCSWWWDLRRGYVMEQVSQSLEADDQEWLRALWGICRWMRGLSIKERFLVFREGITAEERAEFKWRWLDERQTLVEFLDDRGRKPVSGLDPYDFIRAHGGEVYRKLLDSASSWQGWMLSRALPVARAAEGV